MEFLEKFLVILVNKCLQKSLEEVLDEFIKKSL